MRIEYQDHSIEDIIRYWIDGYKLKEGEQIFSYKYWVDQSKDTVVIQLSVSDVSDPA